jgi:hypothetical protein
LEQPLSILRISSLASAVNQARSRELAVDREIKEGAVANTPVRRFAWRECCTDNVALTARDRRSLARPDLCRARLRTPAQSGRATKSLIRVPHEHSNNRRSRLVYH